MKDALLDILYSYLVDESDIDAIRDWIALNVWTASSEDRNIIDQVAVELAYIDDDNSSEHHFRARMAEVLSPTADVAVGTQELEPRFGDVEERQ